ncbi:acyl-CoA thioesterase [Alicyclobacillus tolerans]|uniref:Acyl-CoA thioester hydrolase n=2 Tax=Alicyclobacillus tolerans TaxID=90970 RepID=A0A1M6LBQ6_9BACL|nr:MULTISPECIES: thioesterase family protein [Alicyclobacillus]MDP9727517.1 acyl-CoA thioester hydrolase [Alicyclobacillus tengchongensis]QRF23958.1 acyl-CoA thioesterase [Alicyclobacillus sp. TC]SHJ68572.1 acyl-CoA thioester hydrolase [Alicyclobacillus montanus]
MLHYEHVIRFSDCDGLGHVNNAVYFTMMEEARREVFAWFNPSLSLDSWNLIVASARCDFLAQMTYGETIHVYTWVGKLGNSSFVLEHALQSANQIWVARGQATLLHYDYSKKAAMRIPEDVRRHLQEHLDAPIDAPSLHES